MELNIEKDKDITALTTFGIKVKTRYYAEYSSERELLALSRTPEFLEHNVMHIGGGSNLLFLSDYDGLILHSGIRGIKRYDKNQDTVYVIAGAGEKWTDLVEWTLNEGLGGLENLAGIPGEVGASAVQNIGAYGVEAKDVIHHVECFDLISRKSIILDNSECEFGYRDSAFKVKFKNRYVVMRVSYKLHPTSSPCILSYGPLQELRDKLNHEPTPREVADEVIKIRNAKLPDPKTLGNAGSFFKNPIVRARYLQEMETLSGEKIPSYPVDDTRVKVSAAWLIDHAGLKGTRLGGAAVCDTQPLVLVNEGNAKADDVVKLAELIDREVRRKYYVSLKPEVNYIDTRIRVTVLGSGTSKGVPEIGCECEVCKSDSPKDKRLRASILVEHAGLKILIDASPDFREQALRHNITDMDAVLITHQHYDHVGGIDDLRPLCSNKSMPMYVREDVDADLRRRLDYCFRSHLYPGVPSFDMHIVDKSVFYIKGVKITPIEVMHGKLPILGYRIGNFAYITDAKTISEEEKEKLRGLDTLIVNALRYRDHFAHFTVDEALALIAELKPRRAYLTHFCHEIGLHNHIPTHLPPNVSPCYDGLKILVE